MINEESIGSKHSTACIIGENGESAESLQLYFANSMEILDIDD